MSFADEVKQLSANLARKLPTSAVQTFKAEQRDLAAAAAPAGAATAGTQMPDGELLDVHGTPTSLAAARGGKPAVVVFYRGAWCPYCNLVLREYQTSLVPALTERGAILIAVSPQKPDGSLTAVETNDLTFTVLSDPGNQLGSALGILTAPTDDVVAAQGELGFSLVDLNADGTTTLPMPTTLVVDRDGVIQWIDVHPSYTRRTEIPAILTAVDHAVR